MNPALVKNICFACLFAAFGAAATPLKTPRRMVQGQTVDLKPLFTWWTTHAGDRPLVSWAHITGKVVGTNGFGWIVNAHVEATRSNLDDNDKLRGPFDGNIVLKNPPITEMMEFKATHARFQALTDSVKFLTKRVETAAEKVKQLNAQDESLRKRHARSRAVEQELKNWRATEKNEKTQLDAKNKELAELKKEMKGSAETTFELDCFALETGEKMGRMAMYDHGAPSN